MHARKRAEAQVNQARQSSACSDVRLSKAPAPSSYTDSVHQACLAAAGGNLELLLVLLAPRDAMQIDELDPLTGMSVLQHATRSNAEQCVRQLLALHADPMLEARDGKSALLMASEAGHLHLSRLMLQEMQSKKSPSHSLIPNRS